MNPERSLLQHNRQFAIFQLTDRQIEHLFAKQATTDVQQVFPSTKLQMVMTPGFQDAFQTFFGKDQMVVIKFCKTPIQQLHKKYDILSGLDPGEQDLFILPRIIITDRHNVVCHIQRYGGIPLDRVMTTDSAKREQICSSLDLLYKTCKYIYQAHGMFLGILEAKDIVVDTHGNARLLNINVSDEQQYSMDATLLIIYASFVKIMQTFLTGQSPEMRAEYDSEVVQALDQTDRYEESICFPISKMAEKIRSGNKDDISTFIEWYLPLGDQSQRAECIRKIISKIQTVPAIETRNELYTSLLNKLTTSDDYEPVVEMVKQNVHDIQEFAGTIENLHERQKFMMKHIPQGHRQQTIKKLASDAGRMKFKNDGQKRQYTKKFINPDVRHDVWNTINPTQTRRTPRYLQLPSLPKKGFFQSEKVNSGVIAFGISTMQSTMNSIIDALTRRQGTTSDVNLVESLKEVVKIPKTTKKYDDYLKAVLINEILRKVSAKTKQIDDPDKLYRKATELGMQNVKDLFRQRQRPMGWFAGSFG